MTIYQSQICLYLFISGNVNQTLSTHIILKTDREFVLHSKMLNPFFFFLNYTLYVAPLFYFNLDLFI